MSFQAIKCINRLRIKKMTLRVRQGKGQSAVDKLDKEVKLMLTLHHHNIVRLLEVIDAQRDNRFMFLGTQTHRFSRRCYLRSPPPPLPLAYPTPHLIDQLTHGLLCHREQCSSTRMPGR